MSNNSVKADYPSELFGIKFLTNVKEYAGNKEILNVLNNIDKFSKDELFYYLKKTDDGNIRLMTYEKDWGSKNDLKVKKDDLFNFYSVTANKNFGIIEIRGLKDFEEKKENFSNKCLKEKKKLLNEIEQKFQLNSTNFETNFYKIRGMFRETTTINYEIKSTPVYLQIECFHTSGDKKITSQLILTLISKERWEEMNEEIEFQKVNKITVEEMISSK